MPAKLQRLTPQNYREYKKPQISVLLILSVNISLMALGLRPQTLGDAPPKAGFNIKSPVAYNHNNPYLHGIIK